MRRRPPAAAAAAAPTKLAREGWKGILGGDAPPWWEGMGAGLVEREAMYMEGDSELGDMQAGLIRFSFCLRL